MTEKTSLVIVPDSQDYWQLNLCATALTSFDLVDMDPKVEEQAWLIRRPAKGPPWLIMKSKDDEVQQMKRVAEELLQEQPKIQDEINLMWNHLTTIVPVEKRDDMHPLYQMQFFLFLHMLSILLQGCASLRFGVSASFVDAVGRHFWCRTQVDILLLVARYLYALWFSPAVDAEAWNQGFYGFFIPNNQMRLVSGGKAYRKPFCHRTTTCFAKSTVASPGLSLWTAADSIGNSKRSQITRACRSPIPTFSLLDKS